MSSPANIRCPACQGALIPTQLHCNSCEISITGEFLVNEFASLGQEDLHFLRIFVLCEGHIREMESALGVSYPTIKTRLAKLKETLAAAPVPSATAPPAPAASPAVTAPAKTRASEMQAAGVLRELEAGRLTFEAAMAQLKLIQKEK